MARRLRCEAEQRGGAGRRALRSRNRKGFEKDGSWSPCTPSRNDGARLRRSRLVELDQELEQDRLEVLLGAEHGTISGWIGLVTGDLLPMSGSGTARIAVGFVSLFTGWRSRTTLKLEVELTQDPSAEPVRERISSRASLSASSEVRMGQNGRRSAGLCRPFAPGRELCAGHLSRCRSKQEA